MDQIYIYSWRKSTLIFTDIIFFPITSSYYVIPQIDNIDFGNIYIPSKVKRTWRSYQILCEFLVVYPSSCILFHPLIRLMEFSLLEGKGSWENWRQTGRDRRSFPAPALVFLSRNVFRASEVGQYLISHGCEVNNSLSMKWNTTFLLRLMKSGLDF